MCDILKLLENSKIHQYYFSYNLMYMEQSASNIYLIKSNIKFRD